MSSPIDALITKDYQHGFVTDIAADTIAPGLSEDVVRLISSKKAEPSWMTDWRTDETTDARRCRHRRAGRRTATARAAGDSSVSRWMLPRARAA